MDLNFKKKTLIVWSSSFLPNIGGLESVVEEYANFFSLKNKCHFFLLNILSTINKEEEERREKKEEREEIIII